MLSIITAIVHSYVKSHSKNNFFYDMSSLANWHSNYLPKCTLFLRLVIRNKHAISFQLLQR